MDILVIGRQVKTAFGGVVDLPGLASAGDLYVIELKRDRTPREIVAQVDVIERRARTFPGRP